MSDSPETSPVTRSDLERLRVESAEKTALVQHVREELIRSQITVLELQDTILQKETDKADAVAILGQAELVLEGKINYIFELDRVLNEQIAALKQELSQTRSAHQTITADLVQKLDQANREIGATHTLAANHAREAAEAQEKLAAALNSLRQLEINQRETTSSLAAVRAEKEALAQQLYQTSNAMTALQEELSTIHRSLAWKLTSPFRPSKQSKS